MSKNWWYQGDDHFDDDDPIYTIRFWCTFSSDKSICSVPFHILPSTRLWSAASLLVRMSRFGLFETRVTIVKMLPTPSNLRSRANAIPAAPSLRCTQIFSSRQGRPRWKRNGRHGNWDVMAPMATMAPWEPFYKQRKAKRPSRVQLLTEKFAPSQYRLQ